MAASNSTGADAQNPTDESPPNYRRESARSWAYTGDDYLTVEIHRAGVGDSAAAFNRAERIDGGRFRVVVRDEEPPSTPTEIWEGNAQSDETPREHAREWMREHPEGR